MILGNFRLCALGVLLAGLAAPALAGAADAQPGSAKAEPRRETQASHTRRVELPFLLDCRSPDSEPSAPAPRDDAAPHPFRENLLKRAALIGTESGPAAIRDRRLSRLPDFS